MHAPDSHPSLRPTGTPLKPWHPTQIGRYRIVSVLGEGGMGIVYEAEQETPRRRVALKVVRPARHARSCVRRFAHESEILGRLQHPGIAQIFEAGTAEERAARAAAVLRDGARDEGTVADGRTANELARHAAATRALRRACATRCSTRTSRASSTATSSRPTSSSIANGQPKILDFGVARVTDADVQTTLRTVGGELDRHAAAT